MSINILLQTSELMPIVVTCCSDSNPRPWEIIVIGTVAVRRYNLNLFTLSQSVSLETALRLAWTVHIKLSRYSSISVTLLIGMAILTVMKCFQTGYWCYEKRRQNMRLRGYMIMIIGYIEGYTCIEH